MRVGQAEVSERHANFIVADPGSTSQDVLKLIDVVRERVNERLGIELERKSRSGRKRDRVFAPTNAEKLLAEAVKEDGNGTPRD